MAEPYPRNVPGPFYIENECCITCGVPMDIAPDLFTWDEQIPYPGHCFVSRQLANSGEFDLMLEVMKCMEVDCLRYRGDDLALRARLAREGHKDQCD
ncbi:MAG: hypothetical protein NW203_13320 [Hyphomonadaceae bacterium]|nr:hypothetical protein [Hyphomonadaceae bacterium]